MKYQTLKLSDVIELHDDALEIFGGAPGLRDVGLLESAINHPLMVLEYGEEEHKEIHHLAAAYFFHIIKNHPFVDGNKRTGVLTAITFLRINGLATKTKFVILYKML